MLQFQNSILDHLHHHTFSNMFFDKIPKTHHAQILSCFDLEVGTWLPTQPIFPAFLLFCTSFFTTFRMQLGLPHPSIPNILWCMCTHPIDVMGVHLLCCTHGNEYIGTHDVIRDIFVAITRDVDFHVKRNQLHTLPLTTFHSSRWQVDIMFTKDGIHTLINVVIVDPTRALLFCQSCTTNCYLWNILSQRKELLWPTPHWSFPPFHNWGG
jgi:hypothetical protein